MSALPSPRVMAMLIIAAVIFGIAAGYWIFVSLT